jgi:hypothetical protein
VTALFKKLDDVFNTSFQAGSWYLPDGLYQDTLESQFSGQNLDQLFHELPELNEYTKVASPGILKRICVNGKSFVVKSVPTEDLAAQRNELKSGIAIFETVRKLAPSPITKFKFDLEITVPEAIFCTNTGRILSVMQLHPYPTLDEVLIRSSIDKQSMLEHLKNIRTMYDFFSSQGIFWRDMAPRNILLDEGNLSPRYIVLDFEKTQIGVKDLSVAEQKFWRGAVISEEFLSACGEEMALKVFGDKYDPSSWDVENTEFIARVDMRREIECIVYVNDTRNISVGEYNLIDMRLAATRSPIQDKYDETYFPGKMCFFTDHILGPVYDRKLNEIFLVAEASGNMLSTCKNIHNAMVAAGADVKDLICVSRNSNVLFHEQTLKVCIDDLYNRTVGENRSIDLFLSSFGASETIRAGE